MIQWIIRRRGTPFAKTVIGLFKTEVIKQLGPWKTAGDMEWETTRWVDWYNNHRLQCTIGYIPPTEAEKRFLERGQPSAQAA